MESPEEIGEIGWCPAVDSRDGLGGGREGERGERGKKIFT